MRPMTEMATESDQHPSDPRPRRRVDHRTRPHVYIAAPYSSDPTRGVQAAVAAAGRVLDLHGHPHIPHLTMLWDLIDPHPVEFWYRLDLETLRICDVLWRLPGESAGADREVELAVELDIAVVYDDEGLSMALNFGKWVL